jgi:hypothetical protein
MAELTNTLANKGVKILELRGSPYPEMARAEQVRQALASDIEVLVMLDAHVVVSPAGIERLVSTATRYGSAIARTDTDGTQALECCAVHRDTLLDIIAAEERSYSNSAVDTVWAGETVPSVPIASPWNRDGSSIVAGKYLTDSEAFLERLVAATSDSARTIFLGGEMHAPRRHVRTRVNPGGLRTGEPGSQFALCIPSFGVLDLDQQAAVYALEKAGMSVIRIHDCPWIDQARSWLTEQALLLGKGVFFLDHDIIFQPNDVLRLCEQALERNAVVAGTYCMRRSGKSLIGSYDLPPGPLTFFEGGSTEPAHYSGLGFAAIPSSVFSEMDLPRLYSNALKAWVSPWFALDCSTGFYAGEDVSFCKRVHDLTVKQVATAPGEECDWEMAHSGRPARVFMDTRVRIFHRGAYDYGIEDVGIVVPRIQSLTTQMTANRAEARALLIKADELPPEVLLAAREFPDDSKEAVDRKDESL